jgi:hypothetical protein
MALNRQGELAYPVWSKNSTASLSRRLWTRHCALLALISPRQCPILSRKRSNRGRGEHTHGLETTARLHHRNSGPKTPAAQCLSGYRKSHPLQPASGSRAAERWRVSVPGREWDKAREVRFGGDRYQCEIRHETRLAPHVDRPEVQRFSAAQRARSSSNRRRARDKGGAPRSGKPELGLCNTWNTPSATRPTASPAWHGG